MKFGLTLAESLVPEWREYYIDYAALKHKLKQARDTADEYIEAQVGTSFSIPRAVSQRTAALLQHLQQQQQHEQELPQNASSILQQHAQDTAELLQQQEQQQHVLRRPGSSPGLRVPEALQLGGGPTEQFLQLLQQELNKVRDFIQAQGSSLQADLQALAAAAPHLALQDSQQLERQANELGRQLLALETYMQLNQTGFVKICKKHDKWLPDAPLWHLYLHHLQRSPWLDDSQRQVMWAALSSCYYRLHAAAIYSSRERTKQQRQQQQQQQQLLSPKGSGTVSGVSSSSRMGELTSALGSAVAGAASAVAGAASAVAGASSAALSAAAAAAAGPAILSVPSPGPVSKIQDGPDTDIVKITRKFWVQESDVSALMYYILQHLPLLPSTSSPVAVNQGIEEGGDGVSTSLYSTHQRQQISPAASGSSSQQATQQQQQQRPGTGTSPPQLLQQPALGGFTTTLHTVYLDNVALQLYHGRLYLRPNTQTLKARWIGQGAGAVLGPGCPDKVVLERKIYREGWRGEPNTKDSLLIAGDKLPHYLAGAYTLGDALADLCEVPGCKAQLMSASNAVQQQRRQSQQGAPSRAQLVSPFAQANASAAVAAGGAGSAAVAIRQPKIMQVYDVIGHDAAAAANGGYEDENQAAAAVLAASIRVPQGFAIGSFSSKLGFAMGSDHGSNPNLLQLLERDREQQQQQQRAQSGVDASSAAAEQPTSAAAAASEDDDLQAGFADAYLDPPMPTADQLSLFTEVQRFVGRRRLRPVLHSMLHRMVFAMPFDNRTRITLDTDVRTTVLGQDTPMSAADWQQQQQLSSLLSRPASGFLSPDNSTDDTTTAAAQSAAVSATGSRGSPRASMLPPRPRSSGSNCGTSIPPELQASLAAWDAIFSPQAFTQSTPAASQHSSREPGSPMYGHSSSSIEGSVVYSMPYALLKVTCQVSANQTIPGWLQQLMESEAVIPVEDWSKFIHGCAVLRPETVRAVPYWMDDSLIELSVEALQSQLEAEEARRDQLRLQSLQAPRRNSSTGGLSANGVSSNGGVDATGGADASRQPQQQSPILQRLTGSFKSALNRTSSGTAGGNAAPAAGVHQMLPQLQQQHGGQAVLGTTADAAGFSSSLRQSRLRVSTTGSASASGARVSWADGGPHSTSSQAGGTPTQQGLAMAAAAAAGASAGWLTRLWRLVRKEKPPPLFRPEGGRLRRPRRYNPVQLLESREYMYSEAVFLHWLNLAVTLASVAVLLMGYSSMAYVNPLKRPTMHVAEIICLLMLPCSCIMVGYAIRSYIWRSKRLHSMRYSRVDDQVGPLIMTLVFVTSMAAILLVNIADIVILLREGPDPSGGGDDPEPGGGDDPGLKLLLRPLQQLQAVAWS